MINNFLFNKDSKGFITRSVYEHQYPRVNIEVIPPWQSQGLGGYEQPKGLPIVKV